MNDNLVSFGSAAGAKYRHNPQRFEAPYRLVVRKPATWSPTMHIIQLRCRACPLGRGGPPSGHPPTGMAWPPGRGESRPLVAPRPSRGQSRV